MATIRQHIIDSEGQPEWPYLDPKGHITIGTGFKIDDADAFAKLPLVDDATGKPATDAAKRTAWDAMQREKRRAKAEGHLTRKATEYDMYSSVRMPEPEQNKRLEGEIAARAGGIKTDIGAEAWDRLTDGQKAAAIDIHYANGSLDRF
ncbi:MAG: hypothetical protein VW405_21820, partial [Rhodospirillaceae bacterium]